MRLIVTRPAEDAAPLAARLRARGHDAVIAPMLEIEPAAEEVDVRGVQALAFTSAQAPRLATASWPRHLPVFAVGDATAAAARAAGFAHVDSAAGDVAALARLIAARCDPASGAILHLSGEPAAGDLTGNLAARGFAARRQVVYRTRAAATMPPAAAAALRAGAADGVAFLSPRAARSFVTLARKAALADMLRQVTAFVLSPAVADAAEPGLWRQVVIAPRPDLDAVLDRIDRHEPRDSTARP